MRGEVLAPTPFLLAYLLVLTRIAGAFVFLPFPGIRAVPHRAKIVFAVAIAVSLAPAWPDPPAASMNLIWGWLLCEALLGIAMGLVIALFHESFAIAAQIVALQAGYSYASTIDPDSQTDSGLFPILMQSLIGILFFASDLHLVLWRAFANSLAVIPPGSFQPGGQSLEVLTNAGTRMLELGFKVALPITALLLLVDIALALLGRLSTQLQILTLSFPAKMLGGLIALAALLSTLPVVYNTSVGPVLQSFATLR